MPEIQSNIPLIAALAFMGLGIYLIYVQRSGKVLAGHTVWTQEILGLGDFARDVIGLPKRVVGREMFKEVATPPMYLRDDLGELYFEMVVTKSGFKSSPGQRRIWAGYKLEQCSGKEVVFDIPPEVVNAQVNYPIGFMEERYRYRITSGALAKPGEYVLKAYLSHDFLGQPGLTIDLRVIAGRLPHDMRVIGLFVLIFTACIIATIFMQTPAR